MELSPTDSLSPLLKTDCKKCYIQTAQNTTSSVRIINFIQMQTSLTSTFKNTVEQKKHKRHSAQQLIKRAEYYI